MSDLLDTIKEQYKIAKNRNWDRMYWAIDLHSTVIKPNYDDVEVPTEYYKNAKETMKMLSERSDVVLIMYTCSWPKEILVYVNNFRNDNINFDYINKNPEVDSTGYGFYEDKPYFNIMLDDKAGFKPEKHWDEIESWMRQTKELSSKTNI